MKLILFLSSMFYINTFPLHIVPLPLSRVYCKYPLSKDYYEKALKRLNTRNYSPNNMIGGLQIFIQQRYNNSFFDDTADNDAADEELEKEIENLNRDLTNDEDETAGGGTQAQESNRREIQRNEMRRLMKKTVTINKSSENFEMILNTNITFKDVGGFHNIKTELMQCLDILQNYTKYSKYNVRIPKGLILEGPPGNGKTLLAKAFAGEAGIGVIAVSGSEFQEKYIGVGASRIRELFAFAKKNIPCIIFIDEIDAVGRKRSSDAGEASGSERDSTLNELLVALDGFKSKDMNGVFVMGSTNRIDLLDAALLRPGRIDKKIYIGNPNENERKEIIDIHLKGKPQTINMNYSKVIDYISYMTSDYSGAQIENLLNEAMLNALRNDKEHFNQDDIEIITNKNIGGYMATEHAFNDDMINRICVHEMGHAIMGILSKNHARVKKVVLNLNSPKMPGMTVFEGANDGVGGITLYTKEILFEHLSILFAGRIAEQIIYNASVTTGAINDYEEALKIAKQMIMFYGMGRFNDNNSGDSVIYSGISEKSKENIDTEIEHLLNTAYQYTFDTLSMCKEWILIGSSMLKERRVLTEEDLTAAI